MAAVIDADEIMIDAVLVNYPNNEQPENLSLLARLSLQKGVWKDHIKHIVFQCILISIFTLVAIALIIVALSDESYIMYHILSDIAALFGFFVFWWSTPAGPPFFSKIDGTPIKPEYASGIY